MPDQTNFLIKVTNFDNDHTAPDKIKLDDGVAATAWFSSQGSGLKSGEYNVSITIPLVHTQPKSVQKVFGDKGINLTGEYVNESSKDLGKSANKKVRIDLSLGYFRL